MRVIAGEFRSRLIDAPKGMDTRPSSDRLRETLFNVLAPRIAEARFLDLYAGSGAVGIEALSRGAAEVVFVERALASVKVLRGNLERLGIRNRVRVQAASASTYLSSSSVQFDIVFLDPPYEALEEYAHTLGTLGQERAGLLTQGATVIAEHRRSEQLEDGYGLLTRGRLLKQGDAALSFYELRA